MEARRTIYGKTGLGRMLHNFMSFRNHIRYSNSDGTAISVSSDVKDNTGDNYHDYSNSNRHVNSARTIVNDNNYQ